LTAYVGLPQERSNAVAGLVNFIRNVGSGVGTSLVTAVLAQRPQVHRMMMASHTSLHNPNFRDGVNGLALLLSHFGTAMVDAQSQAHARMYGLLLSQSSAIAYIDVYWLIGVGSIIMIILAFFLKRNYPHQGCHVGVIEAVPGERGGNRVSTQVVVQYATLVSLGVGVLGAGDFGLDPPSAGHYTDLPGTLCKV
jgi:hypothetical protein